MRPPCIYEERRESQQRHREQQKKYREQQAEQSLHGAARRLNALYEELRMDNIDIQAPAFVPCPGLSRSLSLHHTNNDTIQK